MMMMMMMMVEMVKPAYLHLPIIVIFGFRNDVSIPVFSYALCACGSFILPLGMHVLQELPKGGLPSPSAVHRYVDKRMPPAQAISPLLCRVRISIKFVKRRTDPVDARKTGHFQLN